MKGRKKLVTPETKINIDEETFKKKAEEVICEMFVAHVNEKHQSPVLEMKVQRMK